MIPNKTSTKTIDNLNGEGIKMNIDPESFGHIMELLTAPYSDEILAVIREYSTNGRDAQIEAGVDRPIEITLPTSNNPTFHCRDFGTGLNEEDIEKVYSLYGASTKRDSNDYTGAMGIGGKAGLAYGDQFTVIGIKDGIRTNVLVSRSEEGGGRMTVVSQELTEAGNGVEIIVPVESYDRLDFKNTAEHLFSFWPEGSVLVDGEAPERVEGVKITDTILASNELGQDYVVCGCIPYETNFRLKGVNIVVEVPIGSINFEPGRERLKKDKLTKETLAKVEAEFEANREAAVQKVVDAAASKPEALKAFVEAQYLAPDYKPTYKGEEIPMDFYPPAVEREGKDPYTQEPTTYTYNHFVVGLKEHKANAKGYGKGNSFPFETETISPKVATGVLWITGYTNANWGVNNRVKLDGWIEDQAQGFTAKGAIVTSSFEVPHAEWLDAGLIKSWGDEIKKFRLPQAVTANGQPKERFAGTYQVFVNGRTEYKMDADDIDTSKPLFLSTSDWTGPTSALEEVYPGAQIVHNLKSNRVEKFKRLFPEAKDLNEAYKVVAQRWWDKLTDDERRLIQWDGNDDVIEFFSKNDAEKILDPDVRQALTFQHTKLKGRLTSYLDFDLEEISFNLGERYPLLAAVPGYAGRGDEFKDHALTYINDTFKARIVAEASKKEVA